MPQGFGHQGLDGLVREFPRAIAEHFLGAGVGPQDSPLVVADDDAARGGVEEGVIAFAEIAPVGFKPAHSQSGPPDQRGQQGEAETGEEDRPGPQLKRLSLQAHQQGEAEQHCGDQRRRAG